MTSYHYRVFLLCYFFVISLFAQVTSKDSMTNTNKPYVEREFRAAWIATVANIDWPSKPGLSEEEQKKEAIELLDLLEKCNYNAAILQVRPQADALYKSELEPWSYYLTGKQGVAPENFYDPLEFWITESHKRSIELHVWINPYRAHHKEGGEISEFSVVKRKPELVVELKDGYWWFDPSLKKTQDHSFEVVLDIVNRYDIDGVHIDDYFYPYPEYNQGEEFPDDKSWSVYQNQGGKLSRDDWRRESVNVFIERLYDGIKSAKSHVKFGVSPFGIYRPNHPSSIKGFDQYAVLYADARLWLNKGWIDYWSPQLYWTINDVDQSFPVLVGYWESENKLNRHFWPGSSINKGYDETINQIMITRGMLNASPGNVHWNISSLKNDSLLISELAKSPYKRKALVPSSPWLSNDKPAGPRVELKKDNNELIIIPSFENHSKLRNWIFYFKTINTWDYQIQSISTEQTSIILDKLDKNEKTIGISVIDLFGNESDILYFDIP